MTGRLQARLGDRQTLGKDFKFLRRQTLHRAKVPELVVEVAGRVLKPVTVHVGAMNAERPTDGVPEFLGADLVLTGEDFDPVDLLERSLDRYVQPEGEIVYIDTAQFRRQRFLAQNPEVRTAAGHLDNGIHPIPFEFPLERSEIPVSSVVVGVDGDPFRSLGLRVDRIKTDGLLLLPDAFESPDRQAPTVPWSGDCAPGRSNTSLSFHPAGRSVACRLAGSRTMPCIPEPARWLPAGSPVECVEASKRTARPGT